MNLNYSKFWNISDAIKIFNASKSIMYKWINLYKNKLLIRDTNIRAEIVNIEHEKVPKKIKSMKDIDKVNKYIECDIFDERIR